MPFEDMDVWKRSARLSANIYRATSGLRDYGFRDQLTRASLSVPSNIAEGYERDGQQEIARFLSIAKGSCGELVTQIYIGMEAEYIEREQGMCWVKEGKELAAMLGALIKRHRSLAKADTSR